MFSDYFFDTLSIYEKHFLRKLKSAFQLRKMLNVFASFRKRPNLEKTKFDKRSKPSLSGALFILLFIFKFNPVFREHYKINLSLSQSRPPKPPPQTQRVYILYILRV